MPPAPAEELDAETLFRQHAPFVARFLYRLGVDKDAIDDLLQDVFLVVHREGGFRQDTASPTTYLASIAVRLVANQRRRNRTRALLKKTLAVLGTPRSDTSTPVHVLEADETARVLERALRALEPEQRAVFVMAEIEQIPCTEIALALSVPLGTVYWRLHAARAAFSRAILRLEAPEKRVPRSAKGVNP